LEGGCTLVGTVGWYCCACGHWHAAAHQTSPALPMVRERSIVPSLQMVRLGPTLRVKARALNADGRRSSITVAYLGASPRVLSLLVRRQPVHLRTPQRTRWVAWPAAEPARTPVRLASSHCRAALPSRTQPPLQTQHTDAASDLPSLQAPWFIAAPANRARLLSWRWGAPPHTRPAQSACVPAARSGRHPGGQALASSGSIHREVSPSPAPCDRQASERVQSCASGTMSPK
jgi:hypothetical protein